MNKVRLFSCILVFFATFFALPARASAFQADELIRLHIIANSDADDDQSVKLIVRDAIRARAKEIVDSAQSADDAFAALDGAKEALETAAEEALGMRGYAYGAIVELGSFEFPDREYAGTLVPAGTYRAVRIVLGAGEGRNWWCVLYPDLCFVDEACRESAAAGESVPFYSSIVRWIFGWESAQ